MANDKFSRMARTLPSLYKAEVNTMVRGLLKAWSVSDDDIEVQIKETKNQLFVEKAGGRYLDFLGNNVGVSRVAELGIEDDDFRELIPVMSYFPKQVRKTLIALLDVFWGPGFTRANVNSGNFENYNFGPASVLTGTATFSKNSRVVRGVGTSFTTELQPGDYIKPTGSTGTEYQKVSAIIDDTSLELSFAWEGSVAVSTNVSKGVIRTLDYKVDDREESTIRFKPNAFEDLTDVTVQELVDFINNNPEHNDKITASVFLDPQSGNKLNIRTVTPGIAGSIQITGGDANDPSRLNFSLDQVTETKVNVYEIKPNELVVRIPSSVPVLRRTLKGSAHPKQIKTKIYSNPESYDFSSLGATSTLDITIDGNPQTVTFDHSLFADATKVTNEEVAKQINEQLSDLNALTNDGVQMHSVILETTAGSAEYQVTGGTANAILGFDTTLQEDLDIIRTGYPSSYIFDPVGQLFTVTGRSSTLTDTIDSGSITPTITVSDASSFPNQPGKVLFNFGRSNQEGPVNYNSRPNNSALLIDASYTFNNQHLNGSFVNFVDNNPTIPRVTGDDFPVYVVGTEQARQAAEDIIKQLIASGVVIRFLIEFPEYLFECTCRGCLPENDPDLTGSLTDEDPLVF